VKVKARVTVRTHLDRFVGGAKEETIIARVGEGIVSTIGVAESYKHVLESPDSISKTVLARGLDVGSAFEILSIDIADVDVGENVGAKLQEAQAEANKSIAQAQAEIRRAAAVAVEQEMKARVQEMQAKVVEAQAQVPLAMSEAFRNGRLGVMDYYKMQNVQADTSMRESIAQPEGKKGTGSSITSSSLSLSPPHWRGGSTTAGRRRPANPAPARTGSPRRKGSSMKRQLHQATPTARSASARPASRGRSVSATVAGSRRIGQCQR